MCWHLVLHYVHIYAVFGHRFLLRAHILLLVSLKNETIEQRRGHCQQRGLCRVGQDRQESFRLVFSLFYLLVCFRTKFHNYQFANYFIQLLFFRIPMGIIFMIGSDQKLAMEAHLITNLSAHLNSALNPLFYLIFNPKMKSGYVNFFNICCCLRRNLASSAENSLNSEFRPSETYVTRFRKSFRNLIKH